MDIMKVVRLVDSLQGPSKEPLPHGESPVNGFIPAAGLNDNQYHFWSIRDIQFRGWKRIYVLFLANKSSQ